MHMMHVHQRFAVHTGQGFGGRHADRETPRHPRTLRHGDPIDIIEAHCRLIQCLTYRRWYMSVVCLGRMQRVNALGIVVVLAQDDRG